MREERDVLVLLGRFRIGAHHGVSPDMSHTVGVLGLSPRGGVRKGTVWTLEGVRILHFWERL